MRGNETYDIEKRNGKEKWENLTTMGMYDEKQLMTKKDDMIHKKKKPVSQDWEIHIKS